MPATLCFPYQDRLKLQLRLMRLYFVEQDIERTKASIGEKKRKIEEEEEANIELSQEFDKLKQEHAELNRKCSKAHQEMRKLDISLSKKRPDHASAQQRIEHCRRKVKDDKKSLKDNKAKLETNRQVRVRLAMLVRAHC